MCRQTKPKPKPPQPFSLTPFITPTMRIPEAKRKIVTCIKNDEHESVTCGRRSRQGTNTGRYTIHTTAMAMGYIRTDKFLIDSNDCEIMMMAVNIPVHLFLCEMDAYMLN